MAGQSIRAALAKAGSVHEVIFAGDRVCLSGQIDYPNRRAPQAGWPLLFILSNACCTGRHNFRQHRRIGNRVGFAVFRWDKRGTGRSGASGQGFPERDALNAYKTALGQMDIDPTRLVIWAQTDASLLLGSHYRRFKAIQPPRRIILAGNMLDEKAILNIDAPLSFVSGEYDWNRPSRYALKASSAHERHYRLGSRAYVAPYADRRLVDRRSRRFHAQAESAIQDWLSDLCQPSASI